MKAQPFGYKNAWVAVRSGEPAVVAATLRIRNLRASNWESGIAAAYANPKTGSVFVTPAIDGWVLCVGCPLFAAVDARPPTFGAQAAAWARELAAEVQYFATDRVTESHAWARAHPTGLERAYVYVGEAGEKILDEGSPTAEERDLRFAFFDPACAAAATDEYWQREDLAHPAETHVMALAGRWSLDPSTFGDADIDVGAGLVGDFAEALPARADTRAKPWWKVW